MAPALEAPKRVPKDAKVFILPADGFEVYVAATTLLTGQTGSREEASVTVTHVATGTVTLPMRSVAAIRFGGNSPPLNRSPTTSRTTSTASDAA